MPRISDREIKERGLNPVAVRRGEREMQQAEIRRRLQRQHDYAAHHGDNWNARCDYCLQELGYQLRHMSDCYFYDPNETPSGFLR